MESLRHRGPDARGAWVSSNRRVALGHTRLSIIDLETGDQPITNETGRIHIIANGEFYDFERQRSELESLGHVFRTRSDSEIALHLFEEFGTHCMQKLRGDLPFAIRNRPLAFSQNLGGKCSAGTGLTNILYLQELMYAIIT